MCTDTICTDFIDTHWPGTTVEYTCDSGYSIKSGSNDTAMCNSEGEWNVPLPPVCHPGKIVLSSLINKH